MYFGAKFWHQIWGRDPKGQSKKYDVTNTLDQSNHSLHFVEGQRSSHFVMQRSDWQFIFGGVHLNFPQIKTNKKCTKKTIGGLKKK